MSSNTVVAQIREFITDNFLYARPDFVLNDTDALLGSGIVDSMGVMEIVVFLEERFGLEVSDTDITEDNLGSVQAIANYVNARLGEAELRHIA
ncbi:MAG TPA: acyl carrier protein [Longimicrobiaceae bacterium]